MAVLHDLIQRYSFAVLVTHHEGEHHATHLPFLLEPGRGSRGTLLGHMARANPQWWHFDGSSRALVVFQGPHAYISPAWYEDRVTVPTWNYAVVHAHGAPVMIEEPSEMRRLMSRLVLEHESRRASPWGLEEAAPVMEEQMAGIVGFEIPIDRLEGT